MDYDTRGRYLMSEQLEEVFPKVIGCTLCPDLAIPYKPGEGTLLHLWGEHVDAHHPAPEMVVMDTIWMSGP